MSILHIDSSARTEGSVTRKLTALTVAKLGGNAVYRDLSRPLPHVTENWIHANYTPEEERNGIQTGVLALSDTLVEEMIAADTIVIGAPLYNFGVPASLKAWIDQICRVGRTFVYTEDGPVGLLKGKRAIILIATGGIQTGSEADFSSTYLRHVLGFIGITDVEFIAANRLTLDGEDAIASAIANIDKLAA